MGEPARSNRCAAPAVAVVLIVCAALLTVPPTPAAGTTQELRARFAFERQPIPSIAVNGMRTERRVAPGLEKISTWISAVGAAVSFSDLDGNGRSDDHCLVDTRTDTITVSPAVGEPYQPFVLDAAPLPYDATMAPTGCLPGDFNEDGHVDLLAYYWGRTPVLFERVPGRALDRQAYRASELVPEGGRWYTDTVAAADVDGDGHVDLIIGNYFPDGARLLDPAAVEDPQLQMNDSMSRAYNGGLDRILLGRPTSGPEGATVRFEEARGALRPETAAGWTLAIGAQDLDGDMLPELYLAHDFGPDRLLVNRSEPGRVRLVEVKGEGGFTVPKSKVLGDDSFKGMGIDFADMDSDGLTDMFVSNISCEFGLMESNFAWINTGRTGDLDRGAAPFTERSEDLGLARSCWGWDAKFGDFDNDTVPELVQSTGFTEGSANLWPQVSELAMANDELLQHVGAWMQHTPGWELAGRQDDQFFVRGQDGRWAEVGATLGLDDPGVSRGVATSDIDGDGRLDFAVARQWAPSFVYLNRSTAAGPSMSLRLLRPVDGQDGGFLVAGEGDRTVAGSPATGATATLFLPDGRRLSAQVDGGNGHASVRSTELHFGLGPTNADRPVAVELRWRDRDGQVRTRTVDLSAGRHTIRLGD